MANNSINEVDALVKRYFDGYTVWMRRAVNQNVIEFTVEQPGVFGPNNDKLTYTFCITGTELVQYSGDALVDLVIARCENAKRNLLELAHSERFDPNTALNSKWR